MDIGFLTVALGNMEFSEKVKWAGKHGFSGLEVACWPKENTRDYSSTDIDVENFTYDEAAKIKILLKEYHLRITSLAYYDNNLHPDKQIREKNNMHVYRCIDVAELLGVPYVGTFIGRCPGKTVEQNFQMMEEIFLPMVEYAEKKKIGIIIENCQMENWQEPGLPGTISYSPELWDEMFRRIPNKNFGLNFDPSHLLIMGIDYLPLIQTYKDRIFHVHAKDAVVDRRKYQYYGCFNRQLGRELSNGYWEYRIPGRGQVDFEAMIQELRLSGYDGILSIEHEDRLYEGDFQKVEKGLLLGQSFLEQIISDEIF